MKNHPNPPFPRQAMMISCARPWTAMAAGWQWENHGENHGKIMGKHQEKHETNLVNGGL